MRVRVGEVRELRFDDGTPVRAASAIVPWRGGWLVAQDDGTHGAWVQDASTTALRLLPAVEGHDTFEVAAGTKRLKPDLEAGCELDAGRALLLGSGSTPARMSAVVLAPGNEPEVHDLSRLHASVAHALRLEAGQLNLEGACRVGDRLRWFHRGLPSAGLPTASVDVPLEPLLAGAPTELGQVRRYDLGAVAGVGLGVTDAVLLHGERILVSAAAEDSPDAYDDGPVVGAALCLLEDDRVLAVASLPHVGGSVTKVEGLVLLEQTVSGATLLGTVDADDPRRPSLLMELVVDW